jgi:exonuclease SbcD
LAQAGVTVCGDPRSAGQPVFVEATDGGPDLAVYPIPYLEPEIVRHQFDAPYVHGHGGVLRLALDRARADAALRPALRTVAVAHAFAAGGRPSDSERTLSVGGSALVPLRCFDGFDYVALGHLHGRQVLGEGRVRYSGSPVPYSFSERDQRKSVEIVDLAFDGTARAEPACLPEGRRLAALRGIFDDLLTSSAYVHIEDCWVQATITDPVLPRDAMARLRQRFPHAVVLLHDPPSSSDADVRSYRERTRGLGDLDLARRFVTEMTGTPPSLLEERDLMTAIGG